MKLIRCHIENFGVLSDFDFAFDDGLTIICQGNGFGKSTFAAFIKAMFYGFPRTGARNIVENERKRYDPWQGGKYGGYLEFKIQDTSYRVTRYFGKTAAKDTFSLLDLSSRRPSEVYSEKLGEELFRLDADSFARSTYVPQLSASDVEATTSIRTKLSNLVEDTNDLSNYDTAEKKLRDYRTKFRAYRGNGGIINEVRDKHLTLENQKDQAEQQKPRLQDIVEEIEQLNREKTAKTEDVSVLREKIRRASHQKARQVTQRHLGELRTDISKNQQYLHEMDKNYPAGYPTPEEIKTQRENLSVIQQERQRLQALKFNNADREIVDREQQWFADNDKVVSDIDHCDQDCKELGEVSAKVTAQMLPEELERLKILSERFKSSLPTEEELQKYMDIADELSDAQHRQADFSIPVENQKCLARLKELFGSGMPSDSVLDACEQAQHDRDVLKQSRAVHGFPESEQQQYEALKRTFASCVPTEDEIRDKQKDSRRIAELITRKNTQTTIVQQERVSETPPALKMPLLCGGAGVVFLIVGIVGLVLNFLIPGTILLVIGFGALFASFWLHTQSAIKNQKQGTTSVIKASAISDAENQELYDLQHALNDFLLRFYENAAEPDNKLVQLLIDVKTYTELNEKKKTVESELKEIDAEIEGKNQDIRSLFDQYFPHTEYRDDFVKELRESCSRYQTLMAESKAVTEKREALNKKINSCREQIVSVLHTYYPVILPDDLRQGIRELSSEVRDYRELTAKKQAMLEGNAEYQARANALTEEIRRILLSYNALDQTLPYNICLQNLRKRFDGYREATERLARYTQDFESTSSRKMQANALVEQFLAKYQLSGDTPENLLDHADEDVHSRESTEKALAEAQRKLITFMEENPDVENDTADADASIPNMEELQISEKNIQEQIDNIDEKLRNLRQERDSIRRLVENIPVWEDRMARLKIEEENAEKKMCSYRTDNVLIEPS
ncbi:AAA family ATPase [Ruminococcus sp. AM26-12LB]|uniref:AAA family ATPase n=1 Tax=Ruminococcus sp. AM26-12LB TaxID=2293190 RepID=UPI000E46D543|nr:AAA family ATPase [Ruminococcus sp. AM26-12LB]RHU16270.1 hypothetical protein DW694_00345 [Ruminococcus sp. AM26-12LB]